MKTSIILFCLIAISNCFIINKFDAKKDVYFLLRTKGRDFNNEDILNLVTKENLENTAFDPSKPIIFHVHGFTEDRRVSHHLLMDEALLETRDVNLFFIDWSVGAKVMDYKIARWRVNEVSQVIGEFLNFMQEKYDIDVGRASCIGFSLGAHICGLIHKNLKKGNLGRVYGNVMKSLGFLGQGSYRKSVETRNSSLDPAGPLFNIDEPTERISSNSAAYVECIHTGYPLGTLAPFCRVDFFINRGSGQPGCVNLFGIDNFTCSHKRAMQIFTEAIKNPKSFYGRSCMTYERALKGDCGGEPGAFIFDENVKLDNVSKIFYVRTNLDEPFGRGRE